MSSNSSSTTDPRLSPAQTPGNTPFVSVVVPVRNEARCIRRTLAQLVAQDYDPSRFEILVIDGHSSDGTRELAAQFAAEHLNVRLFDNPKRLSSAARNIGVINSKGDAVVIIDGHCELGDDQYIKKLVAAFERSGADCIGRPQPQDISGATALQRAIAAARSSRFGHHPDSFVYASSEGFVPAGSVAAAYRRSVFEAVGCFDESFDACEDVELNHRIDRAGLRCFFTPEVSVSYAPRRSLRGLFRQLFRYGRGRVRLFRKHPDAFSPGILPPPLFVAGLIAGLPLSFVASWLAFIYAAAITAYVAIVLFVCASIAVRRRAPSLFMPLLAVFPTIHVSSGMGMMLELCWIGGEHCEREIIL